MGIDLCQGCGDEHEAPRGAKCKVIKAKVSRKSVKSEPLDEEDSQGATGGMEDNVDKMLALSIGDVKEVKSSSRTRPSVADVEPDEEEIELRRKLAQRVLERRKAKLRAELERDLSSDEEDKSESRSRKKKKEKRKKKKKKGKSSKREKEDDAGLDPSDSPSSSSSSSSSSESSDTDSSRDRSRERRKRRRKKRSKFQLDKYTKGRKSVDNLNYNELMYAACVWGAKRAKKADMSVEALMGYLGHLAYMSMHAITNNYSDEAYRGYDRAIREKAKEKGVRAFRMGDTELSLLHFNMDNSRSHKESKKSRSTFTKTDAESRTSVSSKVKGSCFQHNYNKDGCKRENCTWDHHCLMCRSKSHVAEGCPNKKY